MTVISLVISGICTAHASDSFIVVDSNNALRVRETRRTKIVPVTHFRGAMAYWGLAEIGTWNTFQWLSREANHAHRTFASAEEFAHHIADGLQRKISSTRFHDPLNTRIGVHFTAYEQIRGFWIPELFYISNCDPPYELVHSEVKASRRSFFTISGENDLGRHGEVEYRLAVRTFLQDRMLIFNNGDPLMFNQIGNAIRNSIAIIQQRHEEIRPDQINHYLELARLPVQVVSSIQRSFMRRDARRVGGKPHDLAIQPNGLYSSTTGDKP
ncbi:MAG: hypothetical protein WC880_04825 [Candidatus Paceibacterota bacterium]